MTKRSAALAMRCSNGQGVPKCWEEAVLWYRRSAKTGNDNAQLNLGLCYRDGEGVKRSGRWARYWLSRSARAGNDAAIENLAEMDGA